MEREEQTGKFATAVDWAAAEVCRGHVADPVALAG